MGTEPTASQGRSFLRERPALPAMVVLALVTAGVFWRHLLGTHTFPGDFEATAEWAVFLTSTTAAGHFTEWNPFAGGGLPLPYNPASGLYFPVWLGMGLLHIPATVRVLNLVQAAHVFFGAAGAFALARSLGIRREWALAAGVAFIFFGGLYSNGHHDLIVRGQTYAPWLLWTLTPPPPGRGWLRALGLPFWVWLIASGSYPGQTAAYLLVGAIYLSAHLWQRREELRIWLPFLIPSGIAAAAVLGALYYPALAADRNGVLFRPFPPTDVMRWLFALHPTDLWGLYLNQFAWDLVHPVTERSPDGPSEWWC